MSTTVTDLTLAQACNLLDCGGALDSQNYIDFTNGSLSFSGSTNRNQDLTDLLWRASKQVCSEAKLFFMDVTFAPLANDQKVFLRDGSKFYTDYTTQSSRTYPVTLTQPTAFRVNDIWLSDGAGKVGMWSLNHFNDSWRTWKSASSGRPQAVTVDYGEDCVVFNCPFSSAVVSAAKTSCRGFGHYGQWNYASDSGNPWVAHSALQRAIVYRAIVDSQLFYATEISSLGLMDRLRDTADEDIAKFKDRMTDQLSPLQDTWGMRRPEDRLLL